MARHDREDVVEDVDEPAHFTRGQDRCGGRRKLAFTIVMGTFSGENIDAAFVMPVDRAGYVRRRDDSPLLRWDVTSRRAQGPQCSEFNCRPRPHEAYHPPPRCLRSHRGQRRRAASHGTIGPPDVPSPRDGWAARPQRQL